MRCYCIEKFDWEKERVRYPLINSLSLLAGLGDELNVPIESCDDAFMAGITKQSYKIMRDVNGEVVVPFFRYKNEAYLEEQEAELMRKVLSIE